MALSVGVVVVDGPQAHIVLDSRVVLVLVCHLFKKILSFLLCGEAN